MSHSIWIKNIESRGDFMREISFNNQAKSISRQALIQWRIHCETDVCEAFEVRLIFFKLFFILLTNPFLDWTRTKASGVYFLTLAVPTSILTLAIDELGEFNWRLGKRFMK